MAVADAAVLSRDATAVLFVTSAEQTSLEAAEAALNELGSAGARLLGAVLNRAPITREAFYYSQLLPGVLRAVPDADRKRERRRRNGRRRDDRPQRARHERLALAAEPRGARRHADLPGGRAAAAVAAPSWPTPCSAPRRRSCSSAPSAAAPSARACCWPKPWPRCSSARGCRGITRAWPGPTSRSRCSPSSACAWRRWSAILVLPDHRVENSTSTAVSVGQILLVLWPVGRLPGGRRVHHRDDPAALAAAGDGRAGRRPAGGALRAADRGGQYLGWVLDVRDLRLAVCAGRDVLDHVGAGARVLPADRTAARLRAASRSGKAFLYGYVAVAVLTVLAIRASRLGALLAGAVASRWDWSRSSSSARRRCCGRSSCCSTRSAAR